MNKISRFIIKVVIVFIVFLSFNNRMASAEVDISGQCITLTPAINGAFTANNVCKNAGYYACTEASGAGWVLGSTDCTGGVANFTAFIDCNTDLSAAFLSSSAKLDTLKCRDTRRWGDSPPKPGSVPNDVDSVLLNLINWILGFKSIVAVLMVIWGGVQYLTSAGDESKAENGKKTVTYAFIGLIIAGLAYGIVEVIVVDILA